MSPFERTKLRRESLHTQIAESVQNMIATSELKPGDKLPTEHEMAELFQVSRPTLREAMRLLQQRGLVQMSVGKGTFVKNIPTAHCAESIERYIVFSNCSHQDLLVVRSILEPEIAALAAQHATPEVVAKLEGIIDKMNDKQFQDTEHAAEIDVEFHEALAEATGNPLIIPYINGLHRVMQNWLMMQYVPEDAEQSRRMHRTIFEAVAARNPAAARQAMTDHLKTARVHVTDGDLSPRYAAKS